MDNHPIPQDITGFQFKLIGKMTIKQFVYVAIGAVFAWLFIFILNAPALIKLPLAFISITIGVVIAFVPVDGRPMDLMIRNFITALLAPTQFIYQKGGSAGSSQNIPVPTPTINTQPTQTTNTTPNATTLSTPAQVPQVAQQQVSAAAPPAQMSTTQNPPPVVFPDSKPPTPEPKIEVKKQPDTNINKAIDEIDEKEQLKKQVEQLQKQLSENKQTSAQQAPTPQPVTSEEQKNLEKMLAESTRQREALEKQILEMKAKQEAAGKDKFAPSEAKPQQITQRVKRVPTNMASSVGIPSVPDAPNLITGIVKDPRGNPIQNILIEVKDMDSNPVRAFKTNALGKFASATSLSNGKYVIAFEDPGEKHKFDNVELELVGNNLMPLEVTSVDSREELRRELFN